MPAENIKRASQKGTGELPGVVFEEIAYEGYGPGGVAFIVQVTTDNKTRAAKDVRAAFAKHGVEPEPGSPEALGARIRDDVKKWREVFTSAGIREN